MYERREGGAYGTGAASGGGYGAAGGYATGSTGVSEAVGPDGQQFVLAGKEGLLGDPNAIKAKIKAYPDLEPVLRQLSMRSRGEAMQWLSTSTSDNRLNVIRAMHNQATGELTALRKLALAEGAQKTAAAIDALMLERQGRYETIGRKIVEIQKTRSAVAPRTDTGRSARSRFGGRTSPVNRSRTNPYQRGR
jgi:hypothetical protein